MIDTHCHLDCFDNIDEIVKNMDSIIITSGYDDESNKKVIELVSTYENVYGTLGIHPEEVDNPYNIDYIKENISNPKIIAIGEIGLDYHYTQDNKEKQKQVLIEQLQIAQENNLPVVIHSRDAIMDTYDILKKFNLKGIIHCFSSSLEMANKFIKLGYKIGIGGVVTFKNGKKLKEIVKEISLNDILIETDSPYLAPEPLRGTKNEPKNVYYVLKEVSNIKEIPYDKVLEITNRNAYDLFNI